MKTGDLVICTSARTGEKLLGIILYLYSQWDGQPAYKVLLQDGSHDGIWTNDSVEAVKKCP